jgi:hypothetical protein
MKQSLNFEDLLQINQPQIAEMQRVGESFTSPGDPGAIEAFSNQVRIVEGLLRQTYAVAAAFTKKAEQLEEVAEIWSGLSSFCNRTLQMLASLREKYPSCGTPQLCDLTLDFKLACDKRHRAVLEEIACQNTALPSGLFPATK